jgi:hypothetical protein
VLEISLPASLSAPYSWHIGRGFENIFPPFDSLTARLFSLTEARARETVPAKQSKGVLWRGQQVAERVDICGAVKPCR